MAEYYEIFSNYINLFSIIWGGIKVSLLSFITVLIILVVFRKRVLIRRQYRILKYVAYSYYFALPVICLLLGFIYGTAVTAKNEILARLPLYQSTLQAFSEQYLDVDIVIAAYKNESLDTTVEHIAIEAKQVMLAELTLVKQNSRLVEKFFLTALESPIGMDYLQSKLKQNITSVTQLDRKLVDEIFQIKLSEVLTGEMIMKIVSFYIQKSMNGFLILIMMLWGVLLFIPLAEIVIANYYDKKYRCAYEHYHHDLNT